MTARATLAALLVVATAVLTTPAHAAPRGLELGFFDEGAFQSPDPRENATGLKRAKDTGAGMVRLEIAWRTVSPAQPPSLAVAADPAWSGYDWSTGDEAVRAARVAGLGTILTISKGPRWADGRGRPPASVTVPRETSWRPSPEWFGAFATAAARRYSGATPDPAVPGATLPKVTRWQAWNEPNLPVHLAPQWVRRSSGAFDPASPGVYRGLVNAFAQGIEAVDPRATIGAAGMAPYGDLGPGGRRMPPVRFWRELLCVSAAARARACPRVTFDAIDQHLYPIGSPRRHAYNADDIAVPDLGRLTRVVRAAVAKGTVRPKRTKPLWVTEVSWDSRPDPQGLPLARQAAYLQGALYTLWNQGASLVSWYLLRDANPAPGYPASFQSGVFFRGPHQSRDTPKPSAAAFRFPFAAYRTAGVARLWGKAPTPGAVVIEARRGARWVTVARLTAGSNRVFTGRLRTGSGTALRARSGTDTSPTWRAS